MFETYSLIKLGREFLDTPSSQPPSFLDTAHSDSEVLSHLKFISRIQPGEKINVKHLYIQKDTWQTKVSRSFIYCDSRRNAYNFVVRTIQRAFDIIHLSILHKDLVKASLFLQEIKSTLKGIYSLKNTYSNDVRLCCEFETLISDMNKKYNEIIPYVNIENQT